MKTSLRQIGQDLRTPCQKAMLLLALIPLFPEYISFFLVIAAAGKAVTPGGAVEICHILGREETLRRLDIAVDKLTK